jgi:hypothetical protein
LIGIDYISNSTVFVYLFIKLKVFREKSFILPALTSFISVEKLSWDLSRDSVKGVFSKPTFTKAALRPATGFVFGDKNIYLKVAFFFFNDSISFPSLIRQNLQNQN